MLKFKRDSMMDQKKIGNFIATLRKEKNMTQEDLAGRLFVDRSIVSKWERGLYIPKHDMILKISNIFDVSVNEIYYGERQNDENKEKVNEVPINIMENADRKLRNMKIKSIGMITIIVTLFLFGFFVYYFINTYRSISVYRISGLGEHVQFYNGLMIVSRESSYIQLGEIEYLHDKKMKNIKLYYKNGEIEKLIFEGDNGQTLFINHFDYQEVKTVINNMYIEITYQDDEKETIKLDVKRDFVNKKVFYSSDNSQGEEQSNETELPIPQYILDNFIYKDDEDLYYFETQKGDKLVKQTYYYQIGFYVVEEIMSDHTFRFEYLYPTDIHYDLDSNDTSNYIPSLEECISGECNPSIINYFIDEYINQIGFEK